MRGINPMRGFDVEPRPNHLGAPFLGPCPPCQGMLGGQPTNSTGGEGGEHCEQCASDRDSDSDSDSDWDRGGVLGSGGTDARTPAVRRIMAGRHVMLQGSRYPWLHCQDVGLLQNNIRGVPFPQIMCKVS